MSFLSQSDPDRAQLDAYLQQTAAGDRNAFHLLYQALRTPVYRFALSQLHNCCQAEDVMQDTFCSILRYAGSYRPGTNPKAWIFSIARNQVAALKKDALAGAVSLEAIGDTLTQSDGPTALLDSLSALEALSILLPEEREILSLYLYAGLRQTEIAQLLQMPYLKVRSRYGYAIKKLKAYYTKKERIQP